MVDVRFLLANERTLLAWVRTALALLAAAGGVFEFTDISGRRALAVCLALVGIGAACAGGMRYSSTLRALRAGTEPGESRSPEVLSAAVVLIGIALVVAVLVT